MPVPSIALRTSRKCSDAPEWPHLEALSASHASMIQEADPYPAGGGMPQYPARFSPTRVRAFAWPGVHAAQAASGRHHARCVCARPGGEVTRPPATVPELFDRTNPSHRHASCRPVEASGRGGAYSVLAGVSNLRGVCRLKRQQKPFRKITKSRNIIMYAVMSVGVMCK